MLNKLEHLLVMLGEEANEVAHQCSKAVRFGLDDVYADEVQRRRLAREITHFITTLEELRDELPDVINYSINYSNAARPDTVGEQDMEERKRRMLKYMSYAMAAGHLKKDE